MLDARQIILRPIISEKSYEVMEDNRYTFEVAKGATKIQIAQAVEEVFSVKVIKVNTMSVSGKPRRVRAQPGKTRSWKKAIVKLAPGNTIDAFGA